MAVVSSSSPNRRLIVFSTCVLVISLFLSSWAPDLAQKLVVGNTASLVGGNLAIPPAVRLASLVTVALVGLATVLLLSRITQADLATGDIRSLLICCLPWVIEALEDATLHQRLPSQLDWFYLPLCFVVLFVGDAEVGLTLCGLCAGGTAALSILLGVLAPQLGLQADLSGQVLSSDKAILGTGLLSGVYVSANNLGQFLVLLIPTALYIRRRILRVLVITLSAVAIVWSASRSSVIALCIEAGLALVFFAIKSRASRVFIATFAFSCLFALSLALPYLFSADRAAFTGRGFIWAVSLTYIGSRPITGLGSDFFQGTTGQSSLFGPLANQYVFHAHNQWLQWLVTGGVVLLASGVALVLYVFINSRRLGNLPPVVIYLCAFVVSGSLEVNLGFVGRSQFWASALLPVLLLLRSSGAALRRGKT